MEKETIGVFDGKYMIDENKEFYPVPSNYASKSKLVEGDILKLLVENGNYRFRQIERIERKLEKSVVIKERNRFLAEVISDGRQYEISFSTSSFFQLQDGDKILVVLPESGNSVGCAVENVIERFGEAPKKIDKELDDRIKELKRRNKFQCRSL